MWELIAKELRSTRGLLKARLEIEGCRMSSGRLYCISRKDFLGF